jgi:hypothetical protein
MNKGKKRRKINEKRDRSKLNKSRKNKDKYILKKDTKKLITR